jgi:hypothetical protein
MAKWLFLLILLLLNPGSTVTFIIIDSGGIPVEGVEIYFCGRKAVTDADGTAIFQDIPDLSNTPYGGCTLEIRKEGYTPIRDAFSISEDSVLTYIVYSDITAVISGVVYFDTTDNPASFRAVRIYDAVTGESLPPVLTDEQGRFAFEVPADRPVYVVVSDYEDQRFYLSHEREEILMVNTKGIVTDVTISIRDKNGRPLESVSVTVAAGPVIHEGVTDAEGFLIMTRISNGDYTLTLEKEGYTTYVQPLSIVSQERDSTVTLEYMLEEVVGTVVVEVFTQAGDVISSRIVITHKEEAVAHFSGPDTEPLQIPPGIYTVAVTASGFEPAKRQVLILGGQTNTVTFYLEESRKERKVEVSTRAIPVELLIVAVTAAGVLLYLWKR